MSFDTVLEQWERSPDPKDRDKVRPGREVVESLRGCIPDVCRRIESDPAIDQLLKELLEQLILVNWQDPEVLKDKFQGFCRAHQGKGDSLPEVLQMNLGHVQTRKQFQKCLRNQRKGLLVYGGRISPTPSVTVLLRSTLEAQRSKLGVIKLSRYLMWSFYQPGSPDEPYQDVETSQAELRRRLGLGHLRASDELLFWAHKLDSKQEPKAPTAFDAELNGYFRLGGRSQPLSGNDGLGEVVHPPVDGRQLTRAIEVAG